MEFKLSIPEHLKVPTTGEDLFEVAYQIMQANYDRPVALYHGVREASDIEVWWIEDLFGRQILHVNTRSFESYDNLYFHVGFKKRTCFTWAGLRARHVNNLIQKQKEVPDAKAEESKKQEPKPPSPEAEQAKQKAGKNNHTKRPARGSKKADRAARKNSDSAK